MAKQSALSEQLIQQMEADKQSGSYPQLAFRNEAAIRRRGGTDPDMIWRPVFARDTDKIVYCPYYNRYTDKTQVFSLYKNDDITRRSLHVQLVSRISRTIGAALRLNLDLIEAIALGHDIGHPPFAHSGEKYLDALSYEHTGRHFYHNIHSVRVLDKIFPQNISLQTLDGIAGHNGEFECEEYHPVKLSGFDEFERMIERCYTDEAFTQTIMPSTLEGCVVRLSDIIAYLGKDRQDAVLTKTVDADLFEDKVMGGVNADIINDLVVNVVENSYGKPYIKLDTEHFKKVKEAKSANYALIYNNAAAGSKLGTTVRPMMAEIYGQLLDDLKTGNTLSPVYTHHINYVNNAPYKREKPYEQTDPNQIVIDYIASMTDDYLIELHSYLFPESDLRVEYQGYFNK